jgi:hypothetical protein
MAEEGLATIRNTGADQLRIIAMWLAAALAIAAAIAAATTVILAGEPGPVRAGAAAIPALAALVFAGLLGHTLIRYIEAPSCIECSAIIMMARYRKGRFTGLSWTEISSVLPLKTRPGVFGGPLYGLKLSVAKKKDEVVQNLSLEAARLFVVAYQRNARKLPADEAERLADGMFDIRRF